MSSKVAIITPSIGSKHLAKCVESVECQTFTDLTHFLVADGSRYYGDVFANGYAYHPESVKKKLIMLPENTGKDSGHDFYGHRIYAAIPKLLNSDYIFFLDEDNWYEPDHVEKLVEVLETYPVDFAFSLRNVCSPEGEFICQDNCESTGFPIYANVLNPSYLIDTSCYAFKRDFIWQTAHLWMSGWGGDRRYYGFVRQASHRCSKSYTLNYRLDGNENSVKKEFFLTGNTITFEHYRGKYPWAI